MAAVIMHTLREVINMIRHDSRSLRNNIFSTIRDGSHSWDPWSMVIENPLLERHVKANEIFWSRLDLKWDIHPKVDRIPQGSPSVRPHPFLIFRRSNSMILTSLEVDTGATLVACYIVDFSRWYPSKHSCHHALKM